MNEEDNDLALQTLLAVRAEISPELPEKLLTQCYSIQRRNQFNDDRSISSSAMEHLIDQAASEVSPE